MSRPLRIEYSGAWYHVMIRGRRKENIFLNREDHKVFTQVVRKTADIINQQKSKGHYIVG